MEDDVGVRISGLVTLVGNIGGFLLACQRDQSHCPEDAFAYDNTRERQHLTQPRNEERPLTPRRLLSLID